jgi:pimeloyl-ACP methyl ester carboxylesterase
MPAIPVANASVHYSVSGHGPGLLLVHAIQGSAETNWGQLRTQFDDRFTVITPDYSGSGQTTDDGGRLTTELLAEQIAAVARKAADQPVDLLGYSLGAAVAATTAATHPELVRRMVLVAGFAQADTAYHRLNFELWRDLERIDFRLVYRLWLLTGLSPAFIDRVGYDRVTQILAAGSPVPGLDRQIDLGLRLDIRELLPEITAPTLVIGLTRDQMVPIEASRRLHAAIPGSRYAEIDSGHLVLRERPEELVSLVRDFLGR